MTKSNIRQKLMKEKKIFKQTMKPRIRRIYTRANSIIERIKPKITKLDIIKRQSEQKILMKTIKHNK